MPHSYFITLTYDDDHIPTLDDSGLGVVQTGSTEDIQKFWKRLRINLNRKHKTDVKIRYFAALEYGEKTYRPHYHAIIWSSVPLDCSTWNKTFRQWSQPDVQKAWNKGFTSIDTATIGRVRYIAKYQTGVVQNPILKEKIDIGCKRPRGYQSKGIGRDYFVNFNPRHPQFIYHTQWTDGEGYRMHVMCDGRTTAMPRYFRNKIYSQAQLLHQWEYLYSQFSEFEEFGVAFGDYEELARKKEFLRQQELRKFLDNYYKSKNIF